MSLDILTRDLEPYRETARRLRGTSAAHAIIGLLDMVECARREGVIPREEAVRVARELASEYAACSDHGEAEGCHAVGNALRQLGKERP